jgi:PAS domain S-box-containing protein
VADAIRSPSRRLRSQRDVDARALLDLAYDAIFVRTFADRRIIFWNRGAEQTYGYSARQALGRIPGDLLATEYPVPLEEIETWIAATGRWEGTLLQHRRDGARLIVNARWALERDAAGNPAAILEINSDITEADQALRRERALEDRLRLLVEAVRDYAIFMLDPKGNIASWNTGAARIKGYTAEEAIGRHFSIFYPQEDIAADKPGWELRVATAEGRFEDEGWRLRKDGSRFWANVVITPLFDAQGQLQGFGKVTRDLTERKRAQDEIVDLRTREAEQARLEAERASELERVKSRLLNLASHELRGPLTVIRGYLSMMADGTIGPDRVGPLTAIMLAKATQMNALVQQMLESARLEDSRLQLVTHSTDLEALVRDAVDEWTPLLPAGQQIALDLHGPAVAVVDASRVHIVISNLVDNAIKYSLGRGRITVRLTTAGDTAEISVRDQGPGIDPEQMGLLFERFERIVTPDNQHIPGTGLGLHLARELARLHGGDLVAKSMPGRGMEFVLSLPLEAGPASG